MTNGNGSGGPLVTQDQWMGIVRQLVPFAAGMAVGKGWLTADQSNALVALILQIAGPVGLIGGAVMTYYANSKQSILTSAAAMPEVKKVVVDNAEMANAVTSTKVDTK